jgi:Kyakuja-Dileera-Zisupton transposase
MVDRLLTVYGPRIGCRYDIGCGFDKTLQNSSLGPLARSLQFRMSVNAFHGHAHNRGCQLRWHPLYIVGMGRSEGEGCERIFSASNAVACGTRHATKFHRHQAIKEHFAFWDEDKYAKLGKYLPTESSSRIITHRLGKFLFNHYHAALSVIEKLTPDVQKLQESLGIVDGEFERYIEQERKYLEGLKEEPLEYRLQFRYVDALDDLAQRQ